MKILSGFKGRFITTAVLICVSIVALALSNRSWIASPAEAFRAKTSVPQTQERVEAEIVTLRPWGFEPKEITRPKGKFLLAINNQSQKAEQLTFSFTEDRGKKLKEVKLDVRGKHRANNLYDLNPGRYQLAVDGHPEWILSFNITAR